MKRPNNALLIKAARHIEQDAEELRISSAVLKSDPPVFEDPKDARHYREWLRMAMRLRGLTLEASP